MSQRAGVLVHPATNERIEVYRGFSWPCLFFGCFWYMAKGLWGMGILAFLLACVSFGLSWLVFPFFANDQHRRSFIKDGYVNPDALNRSGESMSEATSKYSSAQRGTKKCPFCAELIKLEAIKCRFCGVMLDPDDVARQILESENKNNIKNRVLCSDGNCIGVIGSDKKCKVCRRPLGSSAC